MKELQNRAARALMALLVGDSKTALEELSVYQLTQKDGEPILVPRERENCPLGRPTLLERPEAWAIGIDLCNGKFGMTDGPSRNIETMLAVTPKGEDACIIHYLSDGTQEIARRWKDGEWLVPGVPTLEDLLDPRRKQV